jgi:hypothetical protein
MLNPESITILDPACGSGHILVEAYDLLKQIYLERGYPLRSIPRLILEKNLFGLDIDDRAAQMAGFALLMKARADDRRLLDDPPRLNVLAIQDSGGIVDSEQWAVDSGNSFLAEVLASLIAVFENAKTFGSLIRIPEDLAAALPALLEAVQRTAASGDIFAQAAAENLLPLVRQAEILAMKFDAVIANPPYMGAKFYSPALKQFVEKNYKAAKGDLYTCFMVRNTHFAKTGGLVGMITIPNWMFLSSFEDLRGWLFEEATIETFCHNGRGVFGSDFGSCAFTFRHHAVPEYKGQYKRLFEKQGSVASNEELNERFGATKPFDASTIDFRKIPGNPIAYWIGDKMRNIFVDSPLMGELVDARQGLATADNDRFLRLWHEVDISCIGFRMQNRNEAKESGRKWFPHQKGGDFRKWYGNHEWVVNWGCDGEELFNFRPRSVIRNPNYYFKENICWSDITVAENAFRYCPSGFINGHTSHAVFDFDEQQRRILLAFGNNKFCGQIIKGISPTVHFDIGYFKKLPFPTLLAEQDLTYIDDLLATAKSDWDSFETSWDFQRLPWLPSSTIHYSLSTSWQAWETYTRLQIQRMQELETENNRLFIEAYGLQDELSPEVPEDQITLARADREKDCQRLISYAIGCMMGRYRLDRPGLIYAHAGNERFWEIYEGEGQVDSGQWIVDSKTHANTVHYSLSTNHYSPTNNEHTKLPGTDCLAESDEPSRANLSSNQDFSTGRDLWTSQPNQASSDVDSVEHRRGTSSQINRGIPEFSLNCPGVTSGSGNTTPNRRSPQIFINGTSETDALIVGRNIEDAYRPSGQTSLTTVHCPLSTKNPFPPDADGILPITDEPWFEDDAASRVREFLLAVWGRETLDENLAWLAESLGRKGAETPEETLRRYLSASFFKDHLQTYKKRPIYWLFSSGRHKAFEALVYLHRCHEGTLARMRGEYVVPLTARMLARIDLLQKDADAASSASARNKIGKQIEALQKKHRELLAFDEKLRHYADMRITLDLDDGVKVNYGKFGGLLAEVKAVTGGSGDD